MDCAFHLSIELTVRMRLRYCTAQMGFIQKFGRAGRCRHIDAGKIDILLGPRPIRRLSPLCRCGGPAAWSTSTLSGRRRTVRDPIEDFTPNFRLLPGTSSESGKRQSLGSGFIVDRPLHRD
jgi:hypothetical protein